MISDESEDEDVELLSNDTGLVIANVWSLVDSTSSKDSTTELIHTPENDDSETTSSTEYQVGGTSSGLPQLKRPISTPFRHSLDPIRLHGLRRKFKERALWIQNGSEVIPESTPNTNVQDSTGPVKEEDSDKEVEDRKCKHLSSTIRRKRKRILRGVIRNYARYADSDSE